MFVITDAETAAFEKAKELETTAQEAQRDFRGVPQLHYNATDEDREANRVERAQKQAVLDEANAALKAQTQTTEFLLYAFKSQMNATINEKIPGGSLPALLTVAEDTVGLLDTENGERVKALARQVFVRFFHAVGDPEINKARAEATATRYRSLIDAGIPEKLAGEILVAEASRPIPTANATAKSR